MVKTRSILIISLLTFSLLLLSSFPSRIVKSDVVNSTCVPVPSGLVYWLQAENDATDQTGVYNGSLQGGTSFTTGMVGNAFSFDGDGDYVEIPSNILLPDEAEPRTLEMWIYSVNGTWTTNSHTAFHTGTTSTRSAFGLDFDVFPRLEFFTWADDLNVNAAVAQEGWFHVAMVYDGGTLLSAYVNGVSGGPKVLGGLLNTVNTETFIGAGRDGEGNPEMFFLGRLDEVTMYNRELGAGEIQSIYNAGSAGKCSHRAPVANAGTDQSVHTLTLVSLDGSASSDPDGETPLKYQWTQTGGQSVSLNNANSVNPSFTAPGNPGALTFSLVVTDTMEMLSAPDEVVITVNNQAPIANAGPDQVVIPSTLVTLNGSGSSDPDGDLPLSFLWVQTGGTTVTLSNTTIANPTFTAPTNSTNLTFLLFVTDSLQLSDMTPDQVNILVNNAPIANAGTDQSVNTLTLVTLNGSGSSDQDGDTPLTYLWTQTNGPSVTLSNNSASSPTFTTPNNPTSLTFSLVVTDSLGLHSVADEVVVVVNNQAPVSNAGPDQVVIPSTIVTLNGSSSTDPDGDLPLTYFWVQNGGTTVTLNSTTISNPTFTAPTQTGVLSFLLFVTDNLSLTDWTPDQVDITVNSPPVANAGIDQSVNSLTLVTLNGSGSSDPDNNLPLTYLWTQSNGPDVTLSSDTVSSPTFTTPDDPTSITFSLVVTDSLGTASSADEVVITVNNQEPISNAGLDQTINMYETVILDGSGSTDPDGDLPLTYAWFQVSGPAVQLINPNSENPTFLPPGNPSIITFSLVVTDNLGLADSTPDEVVITTSFRSIYLPLIMKPKSNESPTDISISNSSIEENQPIDTVVGTLTTTDPDAGNTFTYTLVSGEGSTDNASFNILSNNLHSSATFNYETKSSYNIRVRTTDQGSLFYEETFIITISDLNETPTDITLSETSLAENTPINTVVGMLTSSDPDTGDTFTYDLVSGTGGTDNSSFNILDNQLRTSVVFDYETLNSYSIRIRTTDLDGLFFDKVFIITVIDVSEDPILNGGFEQGRVSWTDYSDNFTTNIFLASELEVPSHGGQWIAALGGIDNEFAYISQVMTIPADRVYLHFWYLIGSDEECGYHDSFAVFVNDSDVVLLDLCYLNNTDSWIEGVVDLTSYAGTSIDLAFSILTDGSNLSTILLDDISLQSTRRTSSNKFVNNNEIDINRIVTRKFDYQNQLIK